MSDARVAIEFPHHSDHFRPGETLVGQYRLERARDEQVIAAEVSVLWRTSGKGDEDLGVHYFQRYDAAGGDSIDAGEPTRFETLLPASPLSYDGVIVKIGWCARVRYFLAGGEQVTHDRHFYLGHVHAPPATGSEVPAPTLVY